MNSGPEPEDSSPVLTWILGYFWSLPRGVSPRLECGHALALSSRAVAAVSRSPPRGSKHLWFSLVSFPRGFPPRLSHRAVPRAHVVGVDPRLERQGSYTGERGPQIWRRTTSFHISLPQAVHQARKLKAQTDTLHTDHLMNIRCVRVRDAYVELTCCL